MKLLYVVLAATIAAGLMSCGKSYSCNGDKICSNDPAVPQSSIDACKHQEAGPCGAQWKALGQCFVDHSTCDSSGKTMLDLNSCPTESSAYGNCCAASDGGTGCL
jgi:hypothetical protein